MYYLSTDGLFNFGLELHINWGYFLLKNMPKLNFVFNHCKGTHNIDSRNLPKWGIWPIVFSNVCTIAQ